MPDIARFARRAIAISASAMVLISCGGDESSDTSPTSPSPTESLVATEAPTTSAIPAESMRGKRYCEILLLAPTESGIVATVFNTYPLGDCPADQWAAIDPAAVAQAEGAALALANGPRFWLMDEVGRNTSDVITKTFGEIPMNRYATVSITDPKSVGIPFTPQKVDRKSTFTFRAEQTVFMLTSADGRRFVMQSWSQQRDPALSESDLADLGPRLELPAGWTYESVKLDEDLVVGADRSVAEVLQDNLLNSYSLID